MYNSIAGSHGMEMRRHVGGIGRLVVQRSGVPMLDVDGPPLPLYAFALPAHLDGAARTNRSGSECLLQGATDIAMLHVFLEAELDPQQARSVHNEVERFLLWMLHMRKKALSSADTDDCYAYIQFMTSPRGPLCGRRARRDSPAWRPFAMDSRPVLARGRAVVILRRLYAFMVEQRYLRHNPWCAVRKSGARPDRVITIPPSQIDRRVWEATVACLGGRAAAADAREARAALAALLLINECRLRRAQATAAVRSEWQEDTPDGLYLSVPFPGRGNGERAALPGPRTIGALRAHWRDGPLRRAAGTGESAATGLLQLGQDVRPKAGVHARIRAQYDAAAALYALLDRNLRTIYPELEAQQGELAPPVHGFIQSLEKHGGAGLTGRS